MTVADSRVAGLRPAVAEVTWRGVLVALAIPFLFLHVSYQPGVAVPLASTRLGIEASDVAVVVLGVAALVEGARRGFGALRAARWAVAAAVALLVWIAVRSVTPFHLAHAVTAAKFAEYALLALVPPLLLRRRADASAALAAVVAWTAVAVVVALVQFVGVDVAGAWPAGRRQPSFLGHNDFAALSGASLVAGAAALAFAELLAPPLAVAACVGGAVGLALAGASAGAAGAVVAVAGVVLAAGRRGRRAVVLVPVVAAVLATAAVAATRSGDYSAFVRFLGLEQARQAPTSRVQTYTHHTLLAYIGLEIFRHHPVVGAGWQRSNDPDVYRPVLPAAHRRFPDVAPLAYPAPSRPYGLQNAYVEAAADLGVVGLLLWLALLAVPLGLAVVALWRRSARAALVAVGAGWLVLCAVLWVPQNLVAGLPLDALTWLGVGTVAAGAARD